MLVLRISFYSYARRATAKENEKTCVCGSAGRVTNCDCFRTGWASSSRSLMVEAQMENSALLRNPSVLSWWTDRLDRHQPEKSVFTSLNLNSPLPHSLRFWGWMREARPSERDRRPLTDRLLLTWWSNWPQVMCILCRVGFRPWGSMRGLLGYRWKPLLLPVIDLYTLRLLLWLWLYIWRTQRLTVCWN